MSEKIYDITVIGGGPVGLFTAFYGGMREASVNIIESLPHLGGQLTALYPEKYIFDVAGFPKVRAQELIDNLEEQAMAFNPTVSLNQEVVSVERMDDETIKLTTDKAVHYTRTIVITAGNGAFQPRKLKMEDTERFEQTNLHYHVSNMDQFRDRKVMIAGGGDSAVDWALMLEPIAEQVTLVHRRDKFRAHEHSVSQLNDSKVRIMTPFTPERMIGEDRIEQVELTEVKGDRVETIDVDDVIVNYGFISSLGPIKDWALEIDKNSIVVNSKMETNIKGIYAAGDICTYPGKVKLIASGFGEGPTAVNNAKAYMDPKARVQPKHSTSMFS
ncbi:thioredoxin reductase (NADPH) [Halobacillus karajensis]|uniref:Ferredoxin--NADP reductase n=1 Tax=Halobacillus karajensis TaxID=195088 RepID=A0A024P9L2_9BACI|nr:NAD(P)/FAD-dependent oxidoreductase [Halobacillus karajensis]CDQ21300.1 Ferredoxin--NADP reductase 2 [Halobacillus karajensis]CDQ25630.1 Ferredoxin--NADP reductase 2 [Halobacillus karajensis]CDQ25901.1 Ferredoxin--NADP reductase 2 [Halobacillus karajensis]SEI10491.1 thioredoxin reductase (NADPH) [Halobacillus karajensis]